MANPRCYKCEVTSYYLPSNSVESGCNSPAGIIPAQKFLQIRMHYSGGNYPCRAILSNQDAFLRRESSLPSNSVKSGCIFPLEIIPAQKFLQIRMHFCGGNHPWRAILSDQDAFLRTEIISDKLFRQEMVSALPMNVAGNWCQPYQ